jgi:NADPH-dependent 2,4-dienoyl-CoA reductase/sulfur reductase-like enzyme
MAVRREHPDHVVVVGAGLGGLRVAEQLRACGFAGHLTLLGSEQHPPYDRPPLSKQVLTGAWEPQRAVLRDGPGLAELDVRFRPGVRAVGLHGTAVELAVGGVVAGDAVVVATGAVARTLPGQPSGAATLRSLDDAMALRAALARAGSLLVIGAGFIGGEVAHAARSQGLDVTVLEALPVPCVRVLGLEAGALAARLLREAGVRLRCGVRIDRFTDDHSVVLADGTAVSADAVLVGVGATPDLRWLAGLDTGNGLTCDAQGRVVGAAGLWAVGDVAAWWDPVRERHHRAEHWTSTVDQAAVVARDVLGMEPPIPGPPYVWSDQFGLKIQVLGRPDLAEETVPLHGAGLDGGPVRGTVVGYLAGDTLVAVAGFGAARHLPRYRALVGAAGRAATLAHADGIDAATRG